MSFLPYSALWMALAVAAVLSLALRSRSRLSTLLPVIMVLLAGALWVWGRPPDAGLSAEASFLSYSWRIGPAVWQLTGLVLAILLTAALCNLSTDARAPAGSVWLLPGTALLPFIWAGDPRSAVLFLALFCVAWAGLLWWSGSQMGRGGALASILLIPLLLIWFADAVALSGSRSLVWLELAGAAIVVAGARLLGVWPLAGWRSEAMTRSLPSAVALSGLPVIAGAAVLLPVTQQASLGSVQIVVGVVMGLMSVLLGLRWAGALVGLQPKGIAGLAAALAGLVLLAAVFTSAGALLAATRVAVFAPLVLLVVGAVPATGRLGWFRVGGVGVVWLAVLGVPLTAGFTGLSSLYAAWQPGPQLLLVAILGLLLVGWSALLSVVALRLMRPTQEDVAGAPANWSGLMPALVPLVALLAVDPAAIAAADAITWAALIVPLVAGPLLAWPFHNRVDLRELDAVRLRPPTAATPIREGLDRARRAAEDAVVEALAILEGPSGLLWVLGIIVLLLLLR